MVNIKFIYMNNIYRIIIKENDLSIENLLNKYASIINIDINNLVSIYKGTNLSNYSKKK